MKIDVHTHTKKCKKGDAVTREIEPQEFYNIVSETDVGIIAITNHNVFDLEQFKEIVEITDGGFQVWPGIELDIYDNGDRGHLIVLVSPSDSEEFSKAVLSVTSDCNPDNFKISIEDTVSVFDKFNPVYIAHYMQKKPNITDSALEKMQKTVSNPNRILKEATNSISAGIFISHGHASIYGSDIHDWSKYKDESLSLPDLRLSVESFEQFCLLLEKDPVTIDTMLNKASKEVITLQPFDDGIEIPLTVYNDINVFFGSKGTGKSCILKAIAKHYSDSGIQAKVFESGNTLLEEAYDIKGKSLKINLTNHNVNYCNDEIHLLRSAKEVDVTSLANYKTYFKETNLNKNSKKILIKDISPLVEVEIQRKFKSYNKSYKKVSSYIDFLEADIPSLEATSKHDVDEILMRLGHLRDNLKEKMLVIFVEWKSIKMINSAIKRIKLEVTKKTGAPSKPASTGFYEYARNRISIENSVKEIVDNGKKAISIPSVLIGSLGENKGELKCTTEVTFQDGSVSNSKFFPLSKIGKKPQKLFAKKVNDIKQNIYSEELFQLISELNSIDDAKEINTLFELLLFKKEFLLNGHPYTPSTGESSMLLLQCELNSEKDIYILDEPEKSLGNDYINDVIVPLIKEKARSGKKIFISTHDANIAVRTLPYNSVYRAHGSDGYKTYLGNPFSNNLASLTDGESIDWKKISMKTLEGGEEAFNERGKIYGNN